MSYGNGHGMQLGFWYVSFLVTHLLPSVRKNDLTKYTHEWCLHRTNFHFKCRLKLNFLTNVFAHQSWGHVNPESSISSLNSYDINFRNEILKMS